MRGEYDLAVMNFGDAIELKPDLVGAYVLRGRAWYASASNVTGVSANFSGVTTTSTGGQASAAQARAFDLAAADFSEALRLDPANAKVYRERGNAYMQKGDFDKAIADYNQAIRLNPDFAEAYNSRGTAYGTKGDFDRAIADFTQALRLDPNYANAYYNRGNAYYMKKDYDKAIADYEACLRLNPNYANAKNNLNAARQARGR
jgi:tetratricopeptide (TPR) repeat protein